MVDLTQYRSHPNKQLLVHTHGVINCIHAGTKLKITKLAAIFHDAGKLNPNFQRKLDMPATCGYSNHSYLSAFAFLCYCASNQDAVLNGFNNEKEWIGSVLAIIAHHHGNLPDFPIILKDEEYSRLLSFLNDSPDLPVSEFLGEFIPHNRFLVLNHHLKDEFKNSIQIQLTKQITNPITFFLETQFAFASLITADKTDASNHQTKEGFCDFSVQFNNKLKNHCNKFLDITDLDKIRSKMRKEAILKIKTELFDGKRIFSLTAPTGSGKTMILLSLAGEILSDNSGMRIIYALPFLSITEQVEKICRNVFKGLNDLICRIDSQTENSGFESFQNALDSDPVFIKDIFATQFAEDTFDYPFIITTFVRLFETLVSNRNATLLKLPNFSNTIFLIDEIQSLPPRLYGFFVALLGVFCKKFNSYAIISSATMPNFDLPNNKHSLKDMFKDYISPPELLSLDYFNEKIFDRYHIERLIEPVNIEQLAGMIIRENKSTLVILNTIQDTKDLFNELFNCNIDYELILLNTHFTPDDRKIKIDRCIMFLDEGKRVVLISTQLIEAGVDIDFPILYRDFCPIPSIVQSSGRCNRNGKRTTKGRIIIFDLQKNDQSRSSFIYRGKDSRFLLYAKEKIQGFLSEPVLFKLQESFFDELQANTLFGFHYDKIFKNGEVDFIQRLKEGAFAEIGKFRLISESDFGEEYRYYITQDGDDVTFEELEKHQEELKNIKFHDFDKRKLKYIQIEKHLRGMAGHIVQVRLKDTDVKPIACSNECCGLLKLSKSSYSPVTGILLSTENQIL